MSFRKRSRGRIKAQGLLLGSAGGLRIEPLECRRLLSADPGIHTSPYLVRWNGQDVRAVNGEFVFAAQSRPSAMPQGWQVSNLGGDTWLLRAPGAGQQQIVSWADGFGARYIEPNYIFRPLGSPVDPQYPSQWHLPRIKAPAAWDVTTGSASVVIAVIDSGIDYNHVDFSTAPTGTGTPPPLDRKNIWTNDAERAGTPGVNDDNNVISDLPGINLTDDIYGYDFGNGDADPMDDDPNPIDREDANIFELGTEGLPNKYTGHGTAVAGVIGAVANTTSPQQMVAGVNWDVKLMALKITRSGYGYVLSAAVEAYKYIQMMKSQFNVNIVVANCSWGTYENTPVIQSLREEIDKAGGLNVLTVAAAGDSGVNIDSTPFYPAAFDSDYVLSVAATNRDDTLWVGSPDHAWVDNVSNFGPQRVDVAAPGKQILTTMSRFVAGAGRGATGNWEGTSMAAGIVTGVAALMKSASPSAPALTLKQVIINTAERVTPLTGLIVSSGIVDAEAAVNEILLPQDPQVDILHAPGQETGVYEGNAGFTAATWQIRVRGPLNDPRPLYVDYRTDGTGSATPDGRFDPRAGLTDQGKKADYVPVVGTMAFLPGPRVVDRLTQVGRTFNDVGRIRNVPVRVFGDLNVEPSETMTLRIDRVYYKNADGTVELANQFILTRTNIFTILNDDQPYDGTTAGQITPTISFVGNGSTVGGTVAGGTNSVVVSGPEGDSATSVMRFPLQLSNPVTRTVTVRYRTWDLDGRAGVDYVPKSGMVTFSPNVTLRYIDIPVIGNRIGQANRSFLVEIFDPTNANVTTPAGNLSGGVGGTAPGIQLKGPTATGTIIDDDAVIRIVATQPPSVGSNAVSPLTPLQLTVAEPAVTQSTSVLNVTLNLSKPVASQVTVRYQTQDLSARAGEDYLAASGVVVFAAGASSATFAVTIRADSFVEGNESFLINLSQPTNAAVLQPTVNVTITNTAAPPSTGTGPLPILAGTTQVREGNAGSTNAVFTIRLAAASSSPVSFSFATVDGTATAGIDYLARSGIVRFAAGQTVATVTVPVLGNSVAQGNRMFALELYSGVGALRRLAGRLTATIIDDDGGVQSNLAVAASSANSMATNPSPIRRIPTLSRPATTP